MSDGACEGLPVAPFDLEKDPMVCAPVTSWMHTFGNIILILTIDRVFLDAFPCEINEDLIEC